MTLSMTVGLCLFLRQYSPADQSTVAPCLTKVDFRMSVFFLSLGLGLDWLTCCVCNAFLAHVTAVRYP